MMACTPKDIYFNSIDDLTCNIPPNKNTLQSENIYSKYSDNSAHMEVQMNFRYDSTYAYDDDYVANKYLGKTDDFKNDYQHSISTSIINSNHLNDYRKNCKENNYYRQIRLASIDNYNNEDNKINEKEYNWSGINNKIQESNHRIKVIVPQLLTTDSMATKMKISEAASTCNTMSMNVASTIITSNLHNYYIDSNQRYLNTINSNALTSCKSSFQSNPLLSETNCKNNVDRAAVGKNADKINGRNFQKHKLPVLHTINTGSVIASGAIRVPSKRTYQNDISSAKSQLKTQQEREMLYSKIDNLHKIKFKGNHKNGDPIVSSHIKEFYNNNSAISYLMLSSASPINSSEDFTGNATNNFPILKRSPKRLPHIPKEPINKYITEYSDERFQEMSTSLVEEASIQIEKNATLKTTTLSNLISLPTSPIEPHQSLNFLETHKEKCSMRPSEQFTTTNFLATVSKNETTLKTFAIESNSNFENSSILFKSSDLSDINNEFKSSPVTAIDINVDAHGTEDVLNLTYDSKALVDADTKDASQLNNNLRIAMVATSQNAAQHSDINKSNFSLHNETFLNNLNMCQMFNYDKVATLGKTCIAATMGNLNNNNCEYKTSFVNFLDICTTAITKALENETFLNYKMKDAITIPSLFQISGSSNSIYAPMLSVTYSIISTNTNIENDLQEFILFPDVIQSTIQQNDLHNINGLDPPKLPTIHCMTNEYNRENDGSYKCSEVCSDVLSFECDFNKSSSQYGIDITVQSQLSPLFNIVSTNTANYTNSPIKNINSSISPPAFENYEIYDNYYSYIKNLSIEPYAITITTTTNTSTTAINSNDISAKYECIKYDSTCLTSCSFACITTNITSSSNLTEQANFNYYNKISHYTYITNESICQINNHSESYTSTNSKTHVAQIFKIPANDYTSYDWLVKDTKPAIKTRVSTPVTVIVPLDYICTEYSLNEENNIKEENIKSEGSGSIQMDYNFDDRTISEFCAETLPLTSNSYVLAAIDQEKFSSAHLSDAYLRKLDNSFYSFVTSDNAYPFKSKTICDSNAVTLNTDKINVCNFNDTKSIVTSSKEIHIIGTQSDVGSYYNESYLLKNKSQFDNSMNLYTLNDLKAINDLSDKNLCNLKQTSVYHITSSTEYENIKTIEKKKDILKNRNQINTLLANEECNNECTKSINRRVSDQPMQTEVFETIVTDLVTASYLPKSLPPIENITPKIKAAKPLPLFSFSNLNCQVDAYLPSSTRVLSKSSGILNSFLSKAASAMYSASQAVNQKTALVTEAIHNVPTSINASPMIVEEISTVTDNIVEELIIDSNLNDININKNFSARKFKSNQNKQGANTISNANSVCEVYIENENHYKFPYVDDTSEDCSIKLLPNLVKTLSYTRQMTIDENSSYLLENGYNFQEVYDLSNNNNNDAKSITCDVINRSNENTITQSCIESNIFNAYNFDFFIDSKDKRWLDSGNMKEKVDICDDIITDTKLEKEVRTIKNYQHLPLQNNQRKEKQTLYIHHAENPDGIYFQNCSDTCTNEIFNSILCEKSACTQITYRDVTSSNAPANSNTSSYQTFIIPITSAVISLSTHQHIKKQESVLEENEVDLSPLESDNETNSEMVQNFKSFSVHPGIIERKEALNEEVDKIAQVFYTQSQPALSQKDVFRCETNSANNSKFVQQNSSLTAKKRWLWAYSKILAQFDVSAPIRFIL